MRRSQRATRKPDFLTFPDNRNVEKFVVVSDSESVESKPDKLQTIPKKGGKKDQNSARIVVKKAQGDVTIPNIDSIVSSIKSNKVSAVNNLVNLCLRAAGCGDWIDEDVDLEPLGPEEIDHLLEDQINKWAESSETKSYPLIEKAKGRGDSYLSKYRSFWVALTEEFLSLRTSKPNSNVNQQLRVILEVLVCFSSIAVAAIRDAVSVSLLSICDAIIKRAIVCKTQLDVLERQQLAFNKSKNKDEDKLSAVKKEKTALEKEMAEHVETIDSLFHTVYMHRSRDTNAEVRLHTLQYLLSFVSFHAQSNIAMKGEYLKYLGWACNDNNESVRLEATLQLKKLLNDDIFHHNEDVNSFVLSFVSRFVQMAAFDVSESVSLEMLRVLRLLQRLGHLDSVSETQLDTVDALVFDAQLSLDIRVEALLFLFEHTEGFDEDDNDVPETEADKTFSSKVQNRRTSKGRLSLDQLKPRKHIALQVETLTEFAEYHLASKGSTAIFVGAALLAEAVLSTHKKGLLCDWTTLFALLMRESEALVSQALRHTQIQALLAMFVFSAKSICSSSESNNNVNKKGSVSVEKEYVLCRQLQELLNLHFKEMLIRFQDEDSQLTLLSELLQCMDISLMKETDLLYVLKLLFYRSSDNDRLQKEVVLALKQWQNNSVSKNNKAVCQRLAQSLASETIEEAVSQLSTLSLENVTKANKKTNNKRQSFGDFRNALQALTQIMKRLRVLSEILNVQYFLTTSNLSILPGFLSDLIEIVRNISNTSNNSNIDKNDLLLVGKDVLSFWLQEILWLFRSLVDQLQVDSLSSSSKNSKGLTLSEESEALLSQLLQRRSELVSTCETLLVNYSPFALSPKKDEVSVRRLGLEAFRIVSALRSFFPLNSKQFQNLASLAFQPSDTLLQALHLVFEQEETRLREQLAEESDENEENEQEKGQNSDKLATELANNLLLPLSRSLLLDVNHLNKRQAAAVLRYLDDDNQHLQEIAKQFGKKLKDKIGLTRVAETCLTCLKLFFQEQVSPWIKQQLQLQQQDTDDLDFVQLEQNEERSYAALQSLAKKLSLQLVPVGRARGETQQCVLALCRAAVDYSLQDTVNCSQVGFSCIIGPFLRLLNDNVTAQLKEHLLSSLQREDTRYIANRIDEERVAPSITFAKLFEVASLLENNKINNNNAKDVSHSSLRRKLSGVRGSGREEVPQGNKSRRKVRGSSTLMDIAEENENEENEENFLDDSDYGRGKNETVMDIDEDFDSFRSSSNKKNTITMNKSNINKNTNNNFNNGNGHSMNVVRRSSSRSLSQKSVNYNEDSDEEEENDEDLMSPIARRPSTGFATQDKLKEKQAKKQVFSPVLDLDVEDDDEDENEFEERKAVLKKKMSLKSYGKRSLPLSDSEDETLDKVPSSRRRFS